MPGFFRGSTDVSSLTLPNEIYIFTEAPFQGMTNLSTIYSTYATSDHRSIVTLNNDLAGFAPSGLTSYTVPSGVKCILEEVFKDASLTTVSLPDGLKSIRASAFEGANITSVVLPGTLTDLKKNAFLDCFNLASIQIGSYLEVIPVGAFKNCSNLQTIEFSTYSRVKDIQSEAFMNCENLSSIVGPTSSVKTIGPNAFSNSGITSINLANVMTLGTEAFSGCEQLADIGTLSADLREIPDGAFYNCPSLTVPEAFTAFFEGTDFEDVIRTAVSLGGDCDTLTCIAGSIAEAFYGVPDDLKQECENRLPDDLLAVLKKFTK